MGFFFLYFCMGNLKDCKALIMIFNVFPLKFKFVGYTANNLNFHHLPILNNIWSYLFKVVCPFEITFECSSDTHASIRLFCRRVFMQSNYNYSLCTKLRNCHLNHSFLPFFSFSTPANNNISWHENGNLKWFHHALRSISTTLCACNFGTTVTHVKSTFRAASRDFSTCHQSTVIRFAKFRRRTNGVVDRRYVIYEIRFHAIVLCILFFFSPSFFHLLHIYRDR